MRIASSFRVLGLFLWNLPRNLRDSFRTAKKTVEEEIAVDTWVTSFSPFIREVKTNTIRLLGESNRALVERFPDQLLLADVVSRLLGQNTVSTIVELLQAIPKDRLQHALVKLQCQFTLPEEARSAGHGTWRLGTSK